MRLRHCQTFNDTLVSKAIYASSAPMASAATMNPRRVRPHRSRLRMTTPGRPDQPCLCRHHLVERGAAHLCAPFTVRPLFSPTHRQQGDRRSETPVAELFHKYVRHLTVAVRGGVAAGPRAHHTVIRPAGYRLVGLRSTPLDCGIPAARRAAGTYASAWRAAKKTCQNKRAGPARLPPTGRATCPSGRRNCKSDEETFAAWYSLSRNLRYSPFGRARVCRATDADW